MIHQSSERQRVFSWYQASDEQPGVHRLSTLLARLMDRYDCPPAGEREPWTEYIGPAEETYRDSGRNPHN